MKRLILSFAALSILCLGVLGSKPAVAATSQPAAQAGITVAPLLQAVSIANFDISQSFSLKVTNRTNTTRNFTVNVTDFGAQNEFGGIAFLGLGNTGYASKHGLVKWLTIDKKNFSLAPNASINLIATIKNDENLVPGGHYGAVLINEVSGVNKAPNTITANPTLSSLVFVTKLGGEQYDLRLRDIAVDGSWWHTPREVRMRFQNPGNVAVVPRGTVRLLGPHDRLVSQGVINEDSAFVLPDSYRQLTTPLRLTGTSAWWPSHYKLQVNYRYDGLAQTASREVSIYVVNLPHLLISTVIIIGLAYALYKYRSSLWKTLKKYRIHP